MKDAKGEIVKKISLIIVSYNTVSLLKDCLNNLFQYSEQEDMEVFVVDNASSDGSADMVKRYFKQANLIENQINMGFAAANNQAYKQAGGEYIILLNPDAFIKPGTIGSAILFMENHPECGLAGGRLVNLQGRLDPSARRFPNSINKLFTLSGLADRYPSSKIIGKGDFKFFDHNSVMEVDWVPGTFTIYRKKMLASLSELLFDERFYIYYEETDLCLQAKRNGWKVFFIPDAEVVHVGGASAKKRDDLTFDKGGSQVLKFRMRSEYLYFRKNYTILSVLANAGVETGWHILRYILNGPGNSRNKRKQAKACESLNIIKHALTALFDTHFGSKVPEIPW